MEKFPSVKVGGEKISFPTKEEVQLEVQALAEKSMIESLAEQSQEYRRDAERYRYIRAAFCKDMKKTHEEFDKWLDDEMALRIN